MALVVCVFSFRIHRTGTFRFIQAAKRDGKSGCCIEDSSATSRLSTLNA